VRKFLVALLVLLSLLTVNSEEAKHADAETRTELFGAVSDMIRELDYKEHEILSATHAQLHPAQRVLAKPVLDEAPRRTLFQFLMSPFRALFHGLTDLTEDLALALYEGIVKLIELPFKIAYHVLIKPLGAAVTGLVDAAVALLKVPFKILDGVFRLMLKALVAPLRLLVSLIELPFKLAYEAIAGVVNAIVQLLEVPFKAVWALLKPILYLLSAPIRAIERLLDLVGSAIHGFWGLLMGAYTLGLIWAGLTMLFFVPIPFNIAAVAGLIGIAKAIDNMGWIKA
jgi:hypothetical protein